MFAAILRASSHVKIASLRMVVVDIGEGLPIAIAHDEASAIVFDGPWGREMACGHEAWQSASCAQPMGGDVWTRARLSAGSFCLRQRARSIGTSDQSEL